MLELRVKGIRQGQQTSETYRLVDYYDQKKRISSMARTTGYTCAAAARLMLNNKIRSGVLAPEHLGQDADCFESLLADLALRNILIKPCP
ncbi:MAG: hypothetical protein DWP95_12930 [Proteobacteria bacterium]|nr:MAG: hypothetical protein DWP95_12930 [Pseudomonadota bacterium]